MKTLPILLTLALSLFAGNLKSLTFASEGDLIPQINSIQSKSSIKALDENLIFPVSNPNSQLFLTVFSKMDLYANIETIGVVVNGTSLPKTAELFYRREGETDWHSGHPLMRIDNGRLVGSLFGLSPATSYDIKVLDGSTEISGSVTTQPDELQFTPTAVLYVDDDASSGGDGSKSKPFKTIQEAVNHAVQGHKCWLPMVFIVRRSHSQHQALQTTGYRSRRRAAAQSLTAHKLLAGISGHLIRRVYGSLVLRPSIKYLARDGQRYYMYDNLTGLVEGRGHNRVSMNEGWYIEPSSNKLYVRSLDDPSKHTWQVPRLNQRL